MNHVWANRLSEAKKKQFLLQANVFLFCLLKSWLASHKLYLQPIPTDRPADDPNLLFLPRSLQAAWSYITDHVWREEHG